nr:MAG TPA: hypothetical protein [Caudoviricetes sp.]
MIYFSWLFYFYINHKQGVIAVINLKTYKGKCKCK